MVELKGRIAPLSLWSDAELREIVAYAYEENQKLREMYKDMQVEMLTYRAKWIASANGE
jgi:hypothetical protein